MAGANYLTINGNIHGKVTNGVATGYVYRLACCICKVAHVMDGKECDRVCDKIGWQAPPEDKK